MKEYKLPKINNEVKITQEQYDELMKKLRTLSLQAQEYQDTLESGITSRNLSSFRNTYVINAQDSLDSTYPMYVHFNIISEMIKIVSVKVSFWILNYRAYSTAAASGGGHTTPSGGGHTTASGGGHTTPSGGGETSGNDRESSEGVIAGALSDLLHNVGDENANGKIFSTGSGVSCATSPHTHNCPNHTHTVSNHQHTVSDHTHTVSDHVHDITYGIYEEETSPTIKFYISENNGISYNDKFFGGYTTNKADIEITSLLTSAGSKLIKFTSDVRARLSIQIEIKLDIRAR